MSPKYIIALSILLSACTNDRPALHIADTRVADVVSRVLISDDRTRAEYHLSNPTKADIYCEGFSTRIVLDDPDSYLETAEEVRSTNNLFLRQGERITKLFRVRDLRGSDRSHIRSVTSLEDRGVCRRATLEDFCRYGIRNEAEKRATESIMQSLGAKDCTELGRFSLRMVKLELPVESSAWPERPVSYLTIDASPQER